jgi:nicotinamide riboside transporter PnuC
MSDPIELLGLLATATAVLGVWANNHKRRVCFIGFVLSNGAFLFIHWTGTDFWSLCLRDGIFLVLAVHGWWLWGKKKS